MKQFPIIHQHVLRTCSCVIPGAASSSPTDTSGSFFSLTTAGSVGAVTSVNTSTTFFFRLDNSRASLTAVTVFPPPGLPHTASICFCLFAIGILNLLFLCGFIAGRIITGVVGHIVIIGYLTLFAILSCGIFLRLHKELILSCQELFGVLTGSTVHKRQVQTVGFLQMRKELCLFGIYQQGNGGRERFFGIFFLVILGRLIFLVGAGTLCCGQDLYILEFRGLGGFSCVLIGCKEHDDVTSFHLAGTTFGKGVDLIDEFKDTTFAILKHNNACGLASRPTVLEAWNDALAGDPVSAFGGVLITNAVIDKAAAEEINKIFFEVIIAPDYDVDALEILGQKKNRIILVRKPAALPKKQFRSLLNGVLVQDRDLKVETPEELKTVTTKAPTAQEIEDMLFANKIVKNSKSNAIVLAKGKQLLASGVGQTSRVDALKQAIEKAKNFGFDLNGAVMASDAFFPFPDCVEIAGNEGVTAVIQPGGSIKDELSFEYCNEHGIAMVTTGFRHFKH